MRPVDWFLITCVVVGVPMAWICSKRCFCSGRLKPPFIYTFGMFVSWTYLLCPVIMVLFFYYSGVIL